VRKDRPEIESDRAAADVANHWLRLLSQRGGQRLCSKRGMTHLDRHRRQRGSRQGTTANLRPAAAHAEAERPSFQRRDDVLGAAAKIVARDVHHLEDGNACVAAQVRVDCGFQRRENQLVAPQRTEERRTLERGDHAPSPNDDAGLRSAEQLVAAEAHQIDAAPDDFCRCWLVLHPVGGLCLLDRAATQVLDERHPLLSRDRCELLGRRRIDETIHEEVAAMHLHDERRVAVDRARVVGHAGLIGGADLAKTGATRLEQLGDAETTTDLQELAAGDDHLGRLRRAEVIEDEHQCGGVVVDHGRCFRATQNRERVLEIRRTASTGAFGQAVLERAVVGANRRQCANRVGRERRTTEIGVDQDPGAIDHGRETRGSQLLQARADLGDDRIRRRNRLLRSKRRQMPAHRVDDDRTWKARVTKRLQDSIYRRDRSK